MNLFISAQLGSIAKSLQDSNWCAPNSLSHVIRAQPVMLDIGITVLVALERLKLQKWPIDHDLFGHILCFCTYSICPVLLLWADPTTRHTIVSSHHCISVALDFHHHHHRDPSCDQKDHNQRWKKVINLHQRIFRTQKFTPKVCDSQQIQCYQKCAIYEKFNTKKF